MRKYLIYYIFYFTILWSGIRYMEQNQYLIGDFIELLVTAIGLTVLVIINFYFIFCPDQVMDKINWLFVKKSIGKKYDLKSLSSLSKTPDLPQGFGYKISWIAIPGTPETFFKSVDCTDIHVANWKTGLTFTYIGNPLYVFVTPTISNWFFVVSGNNFDGNIQFCSSEETLGAYDTKHTVTFLNVLASKIPTFFSFYSYRVSGHYAFCKIKDGKLTRGWASGDGGIDYNFGNYTDKEIELGIDKKIEYSKTVDFTTKDTDIDVDLMFDESDIINLCEKYCLNTLELENYASNPSTGWVCKINY